MNASLPVTGMRDTHRARYRKYETPPPAERFFGKGQLIALALGILALFVLLFPRGLIDRQLATGERPDAAAIAYLHLLLRAQPGDSTLRLQMARAHLHVGQLERAQKVLRPLITAQAGNTRATAMWLKLRRQRLYAAPPGSTARSRARAAYAADLVSMTHRLARPAQLEQIRQAADAGLHQVAARLARNLLASTRGASVAHVPQPLTRSPATAAVPDHDKPPEHERSGFARGVRRLPGLFWSSGLATTTLTQPRTHRIDNLRAQAFALMIDSQLAAGNPQAALRAAQEQVDSLDPDSVNWNRLILIAGWADQPAAAAQFARRWLLRANDAGTRWTAFRALVQAYLAAGEPVQALRAAQAHVDAFRPSPSLWRFMTRLAMQAGDTDASVRYARRLVRLESSHAR